MLIQCQVTLPSILDGKSPPSCPFHVLAQWLAKMKGQGLRIARTPTMTLFIHRITKRKKGLPLRPGGKGGRADDLESFIVRCGHRTLCFSFLFKVTLLVLAEWWRLCNNYELRMSRFWKRDSLTSFSGSENINLRINSPSSPQYNICNH